MSRIEELREPVQPIAGKFRKQGFRITDITSVGLLMVKDWDPNTMSKYIELFGSGLDADAIVRAAEADAAKSKRKQGRSPGAKSE